MASKAVWCELCWHKAAFVGLTWWACVACKRWFRREG